MEVRITRANSLERLEDAICILETTTVDGHSYVNKRVNNEPIQRFVNRPITNFFLFAPFFKYHLVLSLVDTPEKAPPYTLAK